MRKPAAEDGTALHALVQASDYLDTNSLYCYLLICTHFRETSVVAEQHGHVVGFISAYPLPEAPDTLFVWQVGVSSNARRQGIAGKMLREILQRDKCRNITQMETTVTRENEASRRLFQSLQKRMGCPLNETVMFDSRTVFNGAHDTEYLLSIGPFNSNDNGRSP
ncbi:MAG: diaminobutyrate acetyltransferase [Pseudohongiellaceae bacterium]